MLYTGKSADGSHVLVSFSNSSLMQISSKICTNITCFCHGKKNRELNILTWKNMLSVSWKLNWMLHDPYELIMESKYFCFVFLSAKCTISAQRTAGSYCTSYCWISWITLHSRLQPNHTVRGESINVFPRNRLMTQSVCFSDLIYAVINWHVCDVMKSGSDTWAE